MTNFAIASSPESQRATLWMRNWVYANISCLVLLFILGVFVDPRRIETAILMLGIPAIFFGWGTALCHTIELRLKRGSLQFAILGRITCIFMSVLAIGFALLMLLAVWAGLSFAEGRIAAIAFFLLLLSIFFAVMLLRTDKVLSNAITALRHQTTSGFPVELNAPTPP